MLMISLPMPANLEFCLNSLQCIPAFPQRAHVMLAKNLAEIRYFSEKPFFCWFSVVHDALKCFLCKFWTSTNYSNKSGIYRCFTIFSLCFVFFRLTNRCLEWTWMVPVLQWRLGHLVPPWAAGWHPHLVRPSAPSSGSKWMRDDGGQGAPHPSIYPVLLPHHSHPEFYSCTVLFSPLSLSNYYYSGEHWFNLPSVYWSSEREYGV